MLTKASSPLQPLHEKLVQALSALPPEALVSAAQADGERLQVFVRPFGMAPLQALLADRARLPLVLQGSDERLNLDSAMTADAFVGALALLYSAVEPGKAGRLLCEVPRDARRSLSLALVLARAGSDEALDELLHMLDAPLTRLCATGALTHSTHPATDERLLSRLETTKDREVAVALLEALGQRRSHAATEVLVALLRSSDDPLLKPAIAEATARIGEREGLLDLASHLADPHGAVADAAAVAIFALDPAAAFDRLSAHFAEERLSSPQRQAPAITVLRALGGKITFAPHQLVHIARALEEDARWTDLCLRLVHHDEVGHHALDVLPRLHDARVLPTLLSLFGSSESEQLCAALRKLGDPAAIPALEEKLAAFKKKGDIAKVKKLIADLRGKNA